MDSAKKKAAPGANRAASDTVFVSSNRTPPKPTGQCAQVLDLIKSQPGILSLEITAGQAIPECAARVHDLRAAGFNILTKIHSAVEYRGQVRHKVAGYSLGSPAWPRPGFLDGANDAGLLGLDLGEGEQ